MSSLSCWDACQHHVILDAPFLHNNLWITTQSTLFGTISILLSSPYFFPEVSHYRLETICEFFFFPHNKKSGMIGLSFNVGKAFISLENILLTWLNLQLTTENNNVLDFNGLLICMNRQLICSRQQKNRVIGNEWHIYITPKNKQWKVPTVQWLCQKNQMPR